MGAAIVAAAGWFFFLRPAPLPHDAIARAVETRDAQLLERSVQKKIDPNVPNAEGKTPLLLAIEQNDQPLIARLLELGASVDLADTHGVTPLLFAASKGDSELVHQLAGRSASLNAADAGGWTAAHYAVLAQDRASVALLLPALAEVETPTADGRNLIALACQSGDPEIIRAVLDRAPPTLDWNDDTRLALHLALANGDPAFLRLVLSKHPAAPTAEGRTTPLLAHAIANGEGAMFNLLLAAGADPNTALPVPVEKLFVAQLKSEDLRGYVRSDEGLNVLMIAAGLGKSEYVRALLDAGAEKNRLTKRFKMLALYFAAHSGKPKCIQMLLGRGPSPEELRVEISLATQRAAVIKKGVPILQTPISTGRKGFDTPAGEYVITDKNRDHVSSIYKVAMPYFMRLNCRDFGMHAGAVPSYPASHGCIRLPADVAEKLFSEIPVGTVVTIN